MTVVGINNAGNNISIFTFSNKRAAYTIRDDDVSFHIQWKKSVFVQSALYACCVGGAVEDPSPCKMGKFFLVSLTLF